MSKATIDFYKKDIEQEGKRSWIPSIPPEQALHILEDLGDMRRRALLETFVSCWHASPFESAAMWSLYGKSGDAVAIKTRYSSLSNALPACANMGLVDYIDYQRDHIDLGNSLAPYLFKRLSFSHENEVRAIIVDWNEHFDECIENKVVEKLAACLKVPVHLPSVVERIYISPTSKDWFANVVKREISLHGFEFPVYHSNLSDAPVY